MSRTIHGVTVLLGGAWTALLPTPDRERFARPRGYDAPRWSAALGVLQMSVGTALFVYGGLAFLVVTTGDQGMLLLENWFPGLSTNHVRALGPINWIAWFLDPRSWPLAYLALVGLARCLAFAITREAVGEPLVWAALRLGQSVRRRRDRRRSDRRLGPLREDRLHRTQDGWWVLSCREKPSWTDTVTIEIDDRYYRVAERELRDDGPWKVVAYRLEECHAGAVIRRLVRFDAPRDAAR